MKSEHTPAAPVAQATPRRWSLIAVVVLATVVTLLLKLEPATDVHPASAAPAAYEAHAAEQAVAAIERRAAVKSPSSLQRAAQKSATASGLVHFERAPQVAVASTSKEEIDLNVHAAIGIWRPNDHLLRVVLLEHVPDTAEAAQWLEAARAGVMQAPAGAPYGVIDLRFIPTAQAFDRDEVDSGSLTVTSATGLNGAADILGSLEWSGSLPSPRADGAPSVTALQMRAMGSGQSAGTAPWLQQWQFSVAVPVALSEP